MFNEDIPKGLREYLTENIDQGNEVITTITEDGYAWVINPGLNNWVVFIEWYEGCKDYNIVNITGNAFSIVERMMKEVKHEL